MPGQESENVRLVRRMYETWHEDRAASLELLHEDFEFVNPDHAVDPGIRRGHDGYAKVFENLDASFSERDNDVHELVDLGDRILAYTTYIATGRDSGARIEVPEQHVWTLRDGKILRLEWFHDAVEAERAARAR